MRAHALLALLSAMTVLLAGCLRNEAEESGEPTGEYSAHPELEELVSTPLPESPTEIGPEETSAPVAGPSPPAPPLPTPPASPPSPPTTSPPPPATPPTPTTPATPTPVAPTPSTPAPTTPTPTPPTAWPHEGSYVKYSATSSRSSYDGGYAQTDRATFEWTYAGGDWTGTCTVATEEFVSHRGWENRTSTRTLSAAEPPHWPPMNTRSPPGVGESVGVTYLDGCGIAQDTMPYAGTDTEPTTSQGQAVQAETHVADFSNENGAFRSEWSRSTGLVLSWSHHRQGGTMSMSFRGSLVDTDAPLA